jgi:hypothetical protein
MTGDCVYYLVVFFVLCSSKFSRACAEGFPCVLKESEVISEGSHVCRKLSTGAGTEGRVSSSGLKTRTAITVTGLLISS